MPAVRSFHISLYLSLALAVLSIGVAGGDLLPELPFVTGFSLALLGIGYYREGRWELSLRAANMVGLGLGAVLGLWAIFQVVRPPTGLSETLPWPASALPYLAPVLMILIPAKMLRSKHMGDYWAMHVLGILAMALACAMASDGAFIMLFAMYAVAFVWSLTAFHLYRELGPERGREPLRGGRWRGARRALVCSIVAGAAAIPLFWATPRTGSQWELGINTRGRMTGFSDGPLDMNTSGPVAVNQEKVFEVYAEDASGQPILDLPPDQRFRGMHRNFYLGGKWDRNQSGIRTADRALTPPSNVVRNPRERLPNFGPNAIHLTFRLSQRSTRIPPLVDPVAWKSGELAPAVSRYSDGAYRSFVQRTDGAVDGAFDEVGVVEYAQVWLPPERPGESPVMRLQFLKPDVLATLPRGLARLKSYTDRLVERLVSEGTLPPATLTDVDPVTQARLPQYHLAIARALEQHLSASGEFSYTLDLVRQDKEMDPTEDFVLNVKTGHCQRFATALVLMLRSQGIPSQMVVGYRGCESRGDGWYDVREDHAHAWAEVLVPATAEALPPMELSPEWKPMRWVTLDPTPAAPETEAAGAESLFSKARQKWEALLKAILLSYNEDSRASAVHTLSGILIDDGGALYLAAFVLAVVGLRYLRRHWRAQAAVLAGYPSPIRRLAAILTTAGYDWRPGQTAREFAEAAAAGLALRPETAAVADVPVRIVESYYAERFGNRSPSPEGMREQHRDLGRLAAASRSYSSSSSSTS
jgi:transglutaminase-like putative cysteine protease